MDEKVVVDASVWVSSLQQQDVNHAARRLWMEKCITQGGLLIAPTVLLIEVAAAISRRTGEEYPGTRSGKSVNFCQLNAIKSDGRHSCASGS